ncbi:MAG: vitamin K epoxide reductase family protein [Polyangiaceae bacterium]
MQTEGTASGASRHKLIGIVVACAALLGLVFATYSSYDYALHLDRQMHSVHCSFIPGAPASDDGENACKAALFSPYSALFRATYWGGIPISLFAVGSFAFFVGFGVYLALAKKDAPRYAWLFLGTTGFAPLAASIVMFTISATKLGSFCKLCVGVYVASIALAVAAALAIGRFRGAPTPIGPGVPVDGSRRLELAAPSGKPILLVGWLAGLGAASLLPAVVYASSLPDYRAHLSSCGTLTVKTESHGALLKVPTLHPTQPVMLFEDPCARRKAPPPRGRRRARAAGHHARPLPARHRVQLDARSAFAPRRRVHFLARHLCAGNNTRGALEWAFDHQDELSEAGKAGADVLCARSPRASGPSSPRASTMS